MFARRTSPVSLKGWPILATASVSDANRCSSSAGMANADVARWTKARNSSPVDDPSFASSCSSECIRLLYHGGNSTGGSPQSFRVSPLRGFSVLRCDASDEAKLSETHTIKVGYMPAKPCQTLVAKGAGQQASRSVHLNSGSEAKNGHRRRHAP